MIRIEKNGLQWLEFELLANCPEIIHACFTRHGGCSQGECSQRDLASLNLSTSVGDTIENVEENRRRVAAALSLPQLISARQCHGVNIADVDNASSPSISEYDALVTQRNDIGLMILQADCQGAIFYDPIQRVIANVHSGWRGSVQNTYQHMIRYMQKNYYCKPENILVCISPSLGPINSEFVNYTTELPESFRAFQVTPNYFDFWEISKWQLTGAGILPHHIQIACIDTFANSDDYFSHRRCKGSGRQATICALKA